MRCKLNKQQWKGIKLYNANVLWEMNVISWWNASKCSVNLDSSCKQKEVYETPRTAHFAMSCYGWRQGRRRAFEVSQVDMLLKLQIGESDEGCMPTNSSTSLLPVVGISASTKFGVEVDLVDSSSFSSPIPSNA